MPEHSPEQYLDSPSQPDKAEDLPLQGQGPEQSSKLSIISKISGAIAESLDIDKVLTTALYEVGAMLGADTGCIYLVQPDDRLHLYKHHNLSEGFLSEKTLVAMGEGCTGTAAATGEMYTASGRPESMFICKDAGRLLGLDCLVAAPLSAKGQVLGILEYFAPTTRRLLPEEAEILTAISHQIGIAIENAILMRRQTDWANELEKYVAARTEQLVETNNQLIEADQARSEFLAYLSHEVRTPLTTVIGFASMLHDTADGLSEDQRKQLSTIEKNAAHILGLLEDLLGFSKVESGKLEMNPEEFEFAEVAESVLVTLLPKAEVKGLKLSYDPGDHSLPVETDPHKIEQVMLNLVSNAIKFTESGEVTLGWASRSGLLHVWVSDTGPGMEREEAERLFQPYHQLKEGRRDRAGTGLGLYISKHLVELAGGRISVESKPGEGSTFEFMIPLRPKQD